MSEAANADLLIQVVDYSDPHRELMMKTTEDTLSEIGVNCVPMIVALNKADKMEVAFPSREGDNLIMSAMDEKSLQELTTMIKEKIFKNYHRLTLLIPFSDGDVVSYLNENTNIEATDYRDDGTVITAELNDVDAKRFEKYLLTTE